MTVAYINKNSLYLNRLEQKELLLSFLDAKKIRGAHLIENDSFFADFSSFKNYKKIIIASVLVLAERVSDIQSALKGIALKNIEVIFAKENLNFKTQKELDFFLKGFETALFAQGEFSSVKIKNALQKRREKGFKIGRQEGTKNKKKTKCEEYHQYIFDAFQRGETMQKIADEIGVSLRTLFNYKKKIIGIVGR